MPSASVLLVAGAVIMSLAAPSTSGHAADWAGAELAWRNDPRPAADAPLPVEPSQPRRTGRRSVRRNMRRIETAPAEGPNAGMAAEPVGAPAAGLPTTGPAAPVRSVAHRDQSYGDGSWQRFDLYLPDGCSGGGLPLVVWIHGSDWRTGSRADCPVTWLVEQGFAVASIDYRPSDAAVFPAQLDDCRAAIAAIRADAATWGIDPGRICVAGMGGGGHLAALVAFAPHDERPIREASTDDAGTVADDIAAAAVFDAPTHLPSLGGAHDRAGSAASRLVGGPLPEFREAAQKASPLMHVTPSAPPTLIVHGSRGGGVATEQGQRLDAALEAAGVDSAFVLLDAAAGGLAPGAGTPAGGALVEFLDRTVGPGPARIQN